MGPKSAAAAKNQVSFFDIVTDLDHVLPGREDYVRVSLEPLDGKLYAVPLPNKSGAIFTLVKADGMIRIDLNQEGVEQGEEVEVILF